MRKLSIRKISLCFLFLMVAGPIVLRADQTSQSASQEAAPWLKFPDSARTAGMGGAFGAMGEDISTFKLNPAGLVQIDSPQLLLTHNNWFQGVEVEHLSLGMPLGEISGLGLSFDYLNLGTVDSYTIVSGAPVANGTFNPNGFNIGLGYGIALGRKIDVGLVTKYFQQNIAGTSAGGVGVDLGLMTHGFIPHLSVGVAVENIGSQLQAMNLPTVLKVALAFKTNSIVNRLHALNVALDTDFPLGQPQAIAGGVGLEYWYKGTFALRVGDQISQNKLGSDVNGLTFGAGVNIGDFQLNYAFMSNGYVGNSNLISLLIKLDKAAPPDLPSPVVKILEKINKNIQFAFDKANLTPEFTSELDELGDLLLKRPQDRVVLTGFASEEGTEEHNQGLSEARAQATRDRLYTRGVPDWQVITLGRGDDDPIVLGMTEGQLAPNRRVEIKIIQPRPGRD